MSRGRPRGAGIAAVPGGGGGPAYPSAASASRGLRRVLSWRRAVREAPPSCGRGRRAPLSGPGNGPIFGHPARRGGPGPQSPAGTQGPICGLGVWPGGGRRRRARAVAPGFTSHSSGHKILFPEPGSGGTPPGTSRFCFLRLRSPAEEGGLGVLRSPSSPSQRPYAWRQAKHEGSSRLRRLGCFSSPQGPGAPPAGLGQCPLRARRQPLGPQVYSPTPWAARLSASLHRGWVLASLDPRPRGCPRPCLFSAGTRHL